MTFFMLEFTLGGVLKKDGTVRKELGLIVFLLSVYAAEGSGREVEDRFEGLIETSLFLVAAFQCDRFDRVIGFQQTLGREMDPLANNVGVYSGVHQLVKAGLQFFPVDIEPAAECLDRMRLV
jgi:hypothetical protein